jgi:leucyl aminopeptidase
MEYQIKSGAPDKQRTDCAVVGVFQKRKLSEGAKAFDKATGGQLTAVMKSGAMDGRTGQVAQIFAPEGVAAKRILMVGMGEMKTQGPRAYRQAVQAATGAMNEAGVASAMLFLADLFPEKQDTAYWGARHAVEAASAAAYRYEETKSRKDDPLPLKTLAVWVAERGLQPAGEKGIRHGSGIARGVALTRHLGNLPGNHCTPGILAQEARKLAKKYPKLTVKVLGEAEMKKLGMGSLLSVAKGSREEARLIVFEYKGTARKGVRPHVLVGKGLTFDTGGISLKPAPAMDEMKFDMCGGASVFGAVTAACEIGLPIHLVGIVPASENMPDGQANKPGDVVTSMSGQTIEILNTDAEGRLILCDALTYAERYKPAAVIDIATLTGACVIALGSHASGLMSKHQDLADELLDAGTRAWDRAWQLPLWEEYDEQLRTNFADMANIGGKEAGSITAGCFLARYTGKMRWAHLDVAGTAWTGGGGPEKGASGRPVPLLTQYLIDRS